jgi:GNAT superfamily N-acetyltransferase
MIITLSSDIRLPDTMSFEECYEDSLQLDLDEKTELRDSNWLAVWMMIDGVLVGETYGVRLRDLDEEIEDCDDLPSDTIYCYSTTILPPYRGKGLSKVLKGAWLGMCLAQGVRNIVGHASSDEARRLNQSFGAEFIAEHERWYDTDRRASFYRIALNSARV